jgi:hypothetical protein
MFCVRYDPFARQSLHRECWPNAGVDGLTVRECAWCGQRPARLYSYGLVTDWRTEHSGRLFCNLKCREAYVGEK